MLTCYKDEKVIAMTEQPQSYNGQRSETAYKSLLKDKSAAVIAVTYPINTITLKLFDIIYVTLSDLK